MGEVGVACSALKADIVLFDTFGLSFQRAELECVTPVAFDDFGVLLGQGLQNGRNPLYAFIRTSAASAGLVFNSVGSMARP
jgi:hypothetical protein